MHLSDVEYNQYADAQEDEDDWYDDADEFGMPGSEFFPEGWSNKMVAQRTGQAPTPYSVYIKGKEWKSFADDDHAENVANKLRAKFKQEGKDPSVITIAPSGLKEEQKPAGWGEFPPKQEITILPPKKLKSGETHQGINDYWRAQGQAPIYKTNEAKADPLGSWVVYNGNKVKRFKTHTGAKAYAEKNGGKVASSEFYQDKIQGVKEAQTDYQKRRQRERDVDAGKPVPKQRQSGMTDYQKRRVEQKRQEQLGEGADLINLTDLQFYKELLGVMVIPVAAFGAMAWNKTMNAIKLYRAEDVITALQKKGVTVDRSTLEQIKPLLLKLEQAIDVDKDGDVAKELAKRIQQTVTWGKLKQANPKTDAQPKDTKLGENLMKEPTNRKEYLDQRDKLFRMLSVESDSASKQIIKQAIKDLDARYGSAKDTVKEESSTASDAVERAILNRIMVAHTDLLMKFGPEKVMQAVEEVAYNVGDVDEIGTSDVSAYVAQVKQILGVPEELDEKWSAKYKRSINCSNPKGFSQKAHCAGRKK
jgi:hypothetical protein